MNQQKTEIANHFNYANISNIKLFGLSIIAGILGAVGAIVLKLLIAFIFNLAFEGTFSFAFDWVRHLAPSIWGAGVILVPVIGAVLVTWLTSKFAPEAKGHGVPEVLYAIHYKDGIIRPIVAVIKALSSAISIATGGSVGSEGPIVQMGAACGATLGQIIKMPASQRIILIAAGAGAGLAATFNAPLAGIAFAIELILICINALSIAAVTIAVVAACTVIYAIYGNVTLFAYPIVNLNQGLDTLAPLLLLSIPFGFITGLASASFIYLIYWSEISFEKYFKNPYLRHCVGMFGVGLMIYAFIYFYDYSYVAGVGYPTVQDLINNLILNPWLLFLIFIGKLLATVLTLGSGGSGGVFSPSLVLGAALGALYGVQVSYIFPHIDPAIFALAGMAGILGGTTGAFVTAIVLMFEITRDYFNFLPIILTSAIAYFTRVYFSPESIYTLKIFRQGYPLPQGLQARFGRDN
jgi:CIC family chloride channel protein